MPKPLSTSLKRFVAAATLMTLPLCACLVVTPTPWSTHQSNDFETALSVDELRTRIEAAGYIVARVPDEEIEQTVKSNCFYDSMLRRYKNDRLSAREKLALEADFKKMEAYINAKCGRFARLINATDGHPLMAKDMSGKSVPVLLTLRATSGACLENGENMPMDPSHDIDYSSLPLNLRKLLPVLAQKALRNNIRSLNNQFKNMKDRSSQEKIESEIALTKMLHVNGYFTVGQAKSWSTVFRSDGTPVMAKDEGGASEQVMICTTPSVEGFRAQSTGFYGKEVPMENLPKDFTKIATLIHQMKTKNGKATANRPTLDATTEAISNTLD